MAVISPAQCRAARALLNMEAQALAERAGVARDSLLAFEAGASDVDSSVVDAIADALAAAGVVLIEDAAVSSAGGAGVRLTASSDGAERLKDQVQYPEFLSPEASTGSGG